MIVSFPLPLETEQLSERWHRVLSGFDAVVEEEGKAPLVIHVPHGFVTNFASVPRLPFAYLLFGGRGNRAAVVHDYLYEPPTAHPREWCDEVFYAGLRAIPEITEEAARAMYAGVRAGGAAHYGVHDPEQPE
jgi:hypothetical protein